MDIKNVQFKLYQLGYIRQQDITGVDDATTKIAVGKFQADNKLTVTSTMDTPTAAALEGRTNKGNPIMVEEESPEDAAGYDIELEKKAFFDRGTKFRKNNVPITIEYGPNKTSRKTISNVFFRSVGQELDGSGNPIYEVIEFIGRDIKEE